MQTLDTKGPKAKAKAEEFLISDIQNLILPPEGWMAPGSSISQMEYAWFKSREVTKEFLDARLDPPGRLGTMNTPDMEEEAIAKSNNCHSS